MILILMGVIPLRNKFEEFEVQKRGKLITVQITEVPVPFGCKNKYFIKFNYANKRYLKQVGCSFAENHKAGESVQFKHTDGTNIFLFPNENVVKEFLASGTLLLIGFSFIIYSLKNRR